MPTGYTADVQSGKITEFRDFALSCARAFGALIEMRDAPSDAEIPERFERSTYHDDKIRDAQARVAEIEAMTVEQRAASAMAAYREAIESWTKRERERSEQAARYTAMLDKAKAWEPPSKDHEELKTFMVKQLEDSRKFDCTGYGFRPELIPPDDWHANLLKQALRDVEYHAAERVKENHRVESRNLWLKSLRESLR